MRERIAVGPRLGTEQGGSIAADFGSSSGTARAQHRAGTGSLPVPCSEQSCCCLRCKHRVFIYPVPPVCLCRSQLLCGHHDHSRRHRGEGGRLQHLPLPQRGLVEAGAMLQAGVPGQAGSVAPLASSPLMVMMVTKEQLRCCPRVRPPSSCSRVPSKPCGGATRAETGAPHAPCSCCPPSHTLCLVSRCLLCWGSPQGWDWGRTAGKQPVHVPGLAVPLRHQSIHCSHFLHCGSWGFSHLFI